MKDFDARISMNKEGTIWVNNMVSGQCYVRIQGIDPEKIRALHSRGQMIDIRIPKDKKEEPGLIVFNESEDKKAHYFLTKHILYDGHIIAHITTDKLLLIRRLECTCGGVCTVQMKIAK